MLNVRNYGAGTALAAVAILGCTDSSMAPGSEQSDQQVSTARSTTILSGRIVFQSNRADPASQEIYTMNSDGTGLTRLTFNDTFDGAPAWSPNGKQIVFHAEGVGGSLDIWVMNADGTGLTNLTRSPWNDEDPSWAKNKIVFDSDRTLDNQVYIMNADGTGLTQLTFGTESSSPELSPDGKRIVFHSGSDIWVMNANGTGATNLTQSDDREFIASWSPDGKQIVFTRQDENGIDEIFKMNADGTGVTQLTFLGQLAAFGAVFSSNGKQILFSAGSHAEKDIYTMNADGTALTNLTRDPADDVLGDW